MHSIISAAAIDISTKDMNILCSFVVEELADAY